MRGHARCLSFVLVRLQLLYVVIGGVRFTGNDVLAQELTRSTGIGPLGKSCAARWFAVRRPALALRVVRSSTLAGRAAAAQWIILIPILASRTLTIASAFRTVILHVSLYSSWADIGLTRALP